MTTRLFFIEIPDGCGWIGAAGNSVEEHMR